MVTVKVFAGATLAPSAGASRSLMIADGMPYGGIKSSYRTPAAQQALYDGWIRRLPGYNFALPPSQSKHVQGLALDMIVTSPAHKWMLTHAAAYGWHQTALPAEPWHWERSGATPTDTGDDMATEQEIANGVATALDGAQCQDAIRTAVWGHSALTIDGNQVPLGDVVGQLFAHARAADVKADQILAALAKVSAPGTASIDYARIIEGVANELDARELKRITQVKDA